MIWRKKTVLEILTEINQEDHKVAAAVQNTIPEIEKLVTGIVERMRRGGRLFFTLVPGQAAGLVYLTPRRYHPLSVCPTPM